MSRHLVRRVVFLVSIACFCHVSHARAQDRHASSAPVATSNATPAPPITFAEKPKPSIVLTSLYATTILVKGLDAHSTFKAINNGARESNPMIGPLSGSTPGFLALKAGIATATIYAAHSLARRNKIAAIAALVAVNTSYALIVRSNYHVASTMGTSASR
ncbi:MAG: DUF5658 family protein [Gemmatimonadaceae bacterium]